MSVKSKTKTKTKKKKRIEQSYISDTFAYLVAWEQTTQVVVGGRSSAKRKNHSEGSQAVIVIHLTGDV